MLPTGLMTIIVVYSQLIIDMFCVHNIVQLLRNYYAITTQLLRN